MDKFRDVWGLAYGNVFWGTISLNFALKLYDDRPNLHVATTKGSTSVALPNQGFMYASLGTHEANSVAARH